MRHFCNPGPEFSIAPFWFLNEKLQPARLQWQVEEMHRQGVDQFIMHARPGLVTPYLEQGWWEAIEAIVTTASRLGMKAWIYDEYPWASGMAEWRVPRSNPDFVIRGLDRVQQMIDGPYHGAWPAADLLPEGVTLADVLNVTALPAHQTTQPGKPICIGNPGRVDLPPGEWLLTAVFVRQAWNPYGDQFGRLPYTDLCHPVAVQKFISLTHTEYYRRFGPYIGNTITHTFTDEPPSDTPGWSQVFTAEFRHRKGYDPLPHLGKLWLTGPDSREFRLDYYDVLSSLYGKNYFGQIQEWANAHNIKTAGHLLLEETLLFHTRFMGHYFRSMAVQNAPGIDWIFPGRIPASTPKLAASARNVYGRDRAMSETFALTGWQFTFEHMKWMTHWQIVHGIDQIVPHAFYYSITEDEPFPRLPDDLGYRWYDCPPSMFYQQPYWPYYKTYADMVRRTSYLLCQGEHVCDIAVYYPIESVWADFVPDKDALNLHAFQIPGTWMTADYRFGYSHPEAVDAHFRYIADALRDWGYDYDIVDADALRTATTSPGTINLQPPLAPRQYKVVILPESTILPQHVAELLQQFATNGGVVLATGDGPQWIWQSGQPLQPITKSDRFWQPAFDPRHDLASLLGRHIAPDLIVTRVDVVNEPDPATSRTSSPTRTHLPEALDRHPLPSSMPNLSVTAGSAPAFYAQHRRQNGVELYYLVHHGDNQVKVELSLPGSGTALAWDPVSGETHAVDHQVSLSAAGRMALTLNFAPYDAYFITIGHGQTAPASNRPIRPSGSWQTIRTLAGSWQLTVLPDPQSPFWRQDQPPASPLESTCLTVNRLTAWESLGWEALSGRVAYDLHFTCSTAEVVAATHLDLGGVGQVAEVELNGANIGVRLWRPYSYAVQGNLRPGANHLRVMVANTLANAIQSAYGNRGIHWANFAPGSLRSGLLGPVRLVQAK